MLIFILDLRWDGLSGMSLGQFSVSFLYGTGWIDEFDLYFRTVLSSAGNDGRIRLWKATSGNVWRPAGSVGVEQAQETEGAEGKDVDME